MAQPDLAQTVCDWLQAENAWRNPDAILDMLNERRLAESIDSATITPVLTDLVAEKKLLTEVVADEARYAYNPYQQSE